LITSQEDGEPICETSRSIHGCSFFAIRLDALVPTLLQVVQESMQPEQAWLWLKKE
jgi:hypothetical protein